MNIILTFVFLVNGHPYELIREMPNLSICKTAMEMLESYDYIELSCTDQPFE